MGKKNRKAFLVVAIIVALAMVVTFFGMTALQFGNFW